jgi:hypothetical protein
MSLYGLKTMVTRAVTSDLFRTGMINGRRAELIRNFDLDPEERAEIMAIQASTESELYRALDRIILARDGACRPHPLASVYKGIGGHADIRLRLAATRLALLG